MHGLPGGAYIFYQEKYEKYHQYGREKKINMSCPSGGYDYQGCAEH